MELLAQIWCPMEDSPNDRALFLWACANSSCQRKQGRYVVFSRSPHPYSVANKHRALLTLHRLLTSVRAWRELRYNQKYAQKLEKKLARRKAKEAQQAARAATDAAAQKAQPKSNPFAVRD